MENVLLKFQGPSSGYATGGMGSQTPDKKEALS
jgi:hypothetical protein